MSNEVNAPMYQDGTSELILLRALLPWVTVIWAIGALTYFAGVLPRHDALERATTRILALGSWAGVPLFPLMWIVVLLARPPRIQIAGVWAISTVAGSVLSCGLLIVALAWVRSIQLAIGKAPSAICAPRVGRMPT